MPLPAFLACPRCQCGVRARCRVRVGHGHSGCNVHHRVAWGEHLFQSLTLKGVRNRGPLSFCPLTLCRKRLTWPRGPSLLWCPRRGHGTRALSGTQLCHSGGGWGRAHTAVPASAFTWSAALLVPGSLSPPQDLGQSELCGGYLRGGPGSRPSDRHCPTNLFPAELAHSSCLK